MKVMTSLGYTCHQTWKFPFEMFPTYSGLIRWVDFTGGLIYNENQSTIVVVARSSRIHLGFLVVCYGEVAPRWMDSARRSSRISGTVPLEFTIQICT